MTDEEWEGLRAKCCEADQMARDLRFEGNGGVCLREKLSWLFFDGRRGEVFDEEGD